MKFRIKTDKEHLADIRNEIAHRLMLNKADLKYWEKLAKKMKDNTQEKIDALQRVKQAQKRVKEDKIFVKIIDKMFRKI